MRVWVGALGGALVASLGVNALLFVHVTRPGRLQEAVDGFRQPPRIEPRDHVRGSAEGRIAIFEYVDFQCSHSREQDTRLRRLVERHPEVTWIRRHLPHEGHRESTRAAQAAECAAEQRAFWPYADLLFENQADLGDPGALLRLAERAGIDAERFRDCLRTERSRERVRADVLEAARRGIRVTPTLYVGAERHVGVLSYDELERAIRTQRIGAGEGEGHAS